jgi:hypothetical protein
MRSRQRLLALVASITVLGLASRTHGHALEEVPATTDADLVAYAIDDESHELLRYAFADQSLRVVGVVRTSDGATLTEIEGMAIVPGGLHAVAVWNHEGSSDARLVNINLLTAVATLLPCTIGFGGVEGLCAFEDVDSWRVLAIHTGSGESNRGLLEIDQQSGAGTLLMSVTRSYEGLARTDSGELLAATDERVYALDPGTGAETLVSGHGSARIESLEYVAGDWETAIEIDGVDTSWTEQGARIAFECAVDQLVVLQPNGGGTATIATPLDGRSIRAMTVVTTKTDPASRIVISMRD